MQSVRAFQHPLNPKLGQQAQRNAALETVVVTTITCSSLQLMRRLPVSHAARG